MELNINSTHSNKIMNDSFYIGAYWDSRAEPLPQIVDKIIITLKELSGIDEQFINLYELGMSRKEALKNKIVFNKDTIEKLCLQKVKKGELDENGFSKNGFLFGLWTGQSDELSSSISFNVGHKFNSPHLCNSCVINIPFEGKARERLLGQEKTRHIMSTLVEVWEPNYAVLISNSLRDKLDVGNAIGWITYQQSINIVPRFNKGIIYEKTNNGHWFCPASNSYENSLISDLLLIKEVI